MNLHGPSSERSLSISNEVQWLYSGGTKRAEFVAKHQNKFLELHEVVGFEFPLGDTTLRGRKFLERVVAHLGMTDEHLGLEGDMHFVALGDLSKSKFKRPREYLTALLKGTVPYPACAASSTPDPDTKLTTTTRPPAKLRPAVSLASRPPWRLGTRSHSTPTSGAKLSNQLPNRAPSTSTSMTPSVQASRVRADPSAPCDGFSSNPANAVGFKVSVEAAMMQTTRLVGQEQSKAKTMFTKKALWPMIAVGAFVVGRDVPMLCTVVPTSTNKGEREYKFNAATCEGAPIGGGMCPACHSKTSSMNQLFKRKKESATRTPAKQANTRFFTPSDYDAKTDTFLHEKRMYEQKERRRKAKEEAKLFLATQLSDDCGLDLDLNAPGGAELHGNLKTMFESVEVNKYVKDLSDYEIEEKEIATQLIENGKKAGTDKRTTVRYSPAAIKLGLSICQKVSPTFYDKLCRIFHLPTSRRLRGVSATTINEPDGVLQEALKMMIDNYGSFPDCRKIGTLAFDGMMLRQDVAFVGSTLVIEGFGSDALNPSFLVAEFRAQMASTPTASDAKALDRPPYAKHYLTWIFTSNDRKISNTVARYNLANITGPWLADKFIDIVSKLAVAGFMVVQVCPDGATENRSFCHLMFRLLTSTMMMDFPNGTTELPNGTTELPNATCKMVHPCDPDYFIYFVSDWVHWLKKVRNAMVRKVETIRRGRGGVAPTKKARVQPRALKIGVHSVSLDMAKRAYEGVGGCEGGAARFHYLTEAHFDLDAWSKMRFYLAAQVLSATMIKVINEYCDEKGGQTKEEYRGYVSLCENCDLLVDIMNGTEQSKRTGAKKGGKKMWRNVHTDTDTKGIVEKLKGVLLFFDNWRRGCKVIQTDFITKESWEDLTTIICGTVDLVTFYSTKFGADFVWDPRSGGSDVCEAHFANQRAHGNGGAVTGREAKRNANASLNSRLMQGPVNGSNTSEGPKKRKFR